MNPVHQIFILNYVLFPESEEGLHTFMMSNTRNHAPLTDKGRITMMEIPKLINQISDLQSMTHLQQWAYFLKFGNKVDDAIIHQLTFASMEEIIAIQNIFNAPVLTVEEKTCDAFGKIEN